MKYRLHVPVTIVADDMPGLFNARLKLEKAITTLVMEMKRTKGSAALSADFSFRVVEEAAKTKG